MIISVLKCRFDGTQVLEQREVPEDYYAPTVSEPVEPSQEEQSTDPAQTEE